MFDCSPQIWKAQHDGARLQDLHPGGWDNQILSTQGYICSGDLARPWSSVCFLLNQIMILVIVKQVAELHIISGIISLTKPRDKHTTKKNLRSWRRGIWSQEVLSSSGHKVRCGHGLHPFLDSWDVPQFTEHVPSRLFRMKWAPSLLTILSWVLPSCIYLLFGGKIRNFYGALNH